MSHDFDPNVDFSAIQSFYWLGLENLTLLSPFDVKRIQTALREELVNKGLRELTNADVLVAAYLGTSPKRSTKWEYSHGLYWQQEPTNILQSLLVVDVIDAATRSLIWRGRASGATQPDATPEQRERNVTLITKKILSSLPVGGH